MGGRKSLHMILVDEGYSPCERVPLDIWPDSFSLSSKGRSCEAEVKKGKIRDFIIIPESLVPEAYSRKNYSGKKRQVIGHYVVYRRVR